MKYKVFLFILFFLFLFILEAKGDIVNLKNGRSITGAIKKENKEGVWLDVGVGTVKFRWEAIENIQRSTPDEVRSMRQEWRKQEEAEEGLEGYDEKLLKENPELKRILTRHILSREILDRVEEEVKSLSSEDLKLGARQQLTKIIWWWKKWQVKLTEKGKEIKSFFESD